MKKNEILFICGFIALSLIGGVIFLFFGIPKEEKKIYYDIDVNHSVVSHLYHQVNPSDDYQFLYSLYQNGDFSNKLILGVALANFLQDHPGNSEAIPATDVEFYIKKIFGDVSFSHMSGNIVSSYLCPFSYDENTHSYSYLVDCDLNLEYAIKRKVVSAKKSDDEYVVVEKSILMQRDFDDEKEFLYVYNDVGKTKELAKIEKSIDDYFESDTIINNYLNEASTYEYHFLFDGENFVFKEFKRVS